jgi:hypothetical protein
MRKMAIVVALALAAIRPAPAQETPHVEIFAGGTYFDANANGSGTVVQNNVSLRGWNISVAENVNHWFGGAIDVSGVYGTPGGIREFEHSIVGGPVFSYRKNSSLTPFAHAMIGGIRGSRGYLGTSEPVTRFTAVFGGGLDWKIRNHVALRLFQADYQVTPFFNQAQANFRLSAGVVLRWGKK